MEISNLERHDVFAPLGDYCSSLSNFSAPTECISLKSRALCSALKVPFASRRVQKGVVALLFDFKSDAGEKPRFVETFNYTPCNRLLLLKAFYLTAKCKLPALQLDLIYDQVTWNH
jgi:hypothetical protein